MPVLGDARYYWLTVGLVAFAAIGLGFSISVIAASETQAVQFSMLVLLASVFFGGFFIPTDLLYGWLHTAAFALPVTYGAIALRGIMLRGAAPDASLLAGLLVIGAILYVLAFLGLRRQMRHG